MLKGIDVSSWQAGIKPSKLDIDFCISKATESTDYVNPYCDAVIQDCIANNILFAFYHYALNGNPILESQWFVNNTKGYHLKGIPALDFEEWTNSQADVNFCEKFLSEYHRITKVWPLLYISASRCNAFSKSWIPSKCGLWVAGYDKDYDKWPNHCPYDVNPWEWPAIWQFASDWHMSGYSGDLDANIAFMDGKGWSRYAIGENSSSGIEQGSKPSQTGNGKGKTCEELAKEVIVGKWGNGWNRKTALDNAYGPGTYDHVQCIVDNLLGLDGC